MSKEPKIPIRVQKRVCRMKVTDAMVEAGMHAWRDYWQTMRPFKEKLNDFNAMKQALEAALVEAPVSEVWPIKTDDQVELLARECDWDNRKYMTAKDYSIWCERMRKFARLANPAPSRESVAPVPEAVTDTCEKCGGEGTLYTSKYGGNDPDVWPIGTCEECEGTGKCQYAEAVAMPEYRCVGECQYAAAPVASPSRESVVSDEVIGVYEQALRDATEPFLDWLEQREEGAHIKEVREGLIGVEDVIPDSHVVLGAHLRADAGRVLTVGHFRKLRDAYDGNVNRSLPSRESAVREAATAGWNACRKSIYAVCEDVINENEKHLSDTENEPRYHFGRGGMRAAKSIARGFNSMEAEDDDNFTAALLGTDKNTSPSLGDSEDGEAA